LFIGDLYFDELADSGWYKLVRSRTPPGQPIDLIATRRPYDDPGTETFYYRLQQRYTARLAKRHMPYALNRARMARWRELFLQPDYAVAALPGYQSKDNANPFVTFEQLPVNARYRFMLDEAHFTIQAYIKGPVCRGQVALNVIDDHFWVAFIKPNPVDPEQSAAFLAREAKHMRLPQPKGSLVVTLLQWRGYAKDQRRYLRAEARAISNLIDQGEVALDTHIIWDGGPEQNPNAALTVFRHFDAATVSQGFIGQQPKTAWVIDYSLLERIHYLLVAGFDVYGAVGHQLESRLYMDFLRMEGEQNFLLFLPAEERKALRNYWYRGAEDHVRKFVLSEKNERFERYTAIDFQTDDPMAEFLAMLKAHIPAARNPRWQVEEPALAGLMTLRGKHFHFLPEVAFLQVLRASGQRDVYSLVHNHAHSNIAQLFNESDRLLPAEDTLTVARGFVGSYPNMFFQVHEKELEKFIAGLTELADERDYTRLVDRWGVRRTDPSFWRVSDGLVETYRETHPVEAGLFDLNRYQNR
ncbi:MAG: fatty acid cis/trans isomerase, partial [Halieaceae bacterium]|nr:fatty acid cis/trans isomerase [Halieaceae bacterium]